MQPQEGRAEIPLSPLKTWSVGCLRRPIVEKQKIHATHAVRSPEAGSRVGSEGSVTYAEGA